MYNQKLERWKGDCIWQALEWEVHSPAGQIHLEAERGCYMFFKGLLKNNNNNEEYL